jgi:succinate dehydrogenase/fumarate reductase cytochrome b subunit
VFYVKDVLNNELFTAEKSGPSFYSGTANLPASWWIIAVFAGYYCGLR